MTRLRSLRFCIGLHSNQDLSDRSRLANQHVQTKHNFNSDCRPPFSQSQTSRSLWSSGHIRLPVISRGITFVIQFDACRISTRSERQSCAALTGARSNIGPTIVVCAYCELVVTRKLDGFVCSLHKGLVRKKR